VALVGAWVAGVALRQTGPLVTLTMFAWLLLAGLCAAIWLVAGVGLRLSTVGAPGRWWRLALVTGMLGCWMALGAARAAAADSSTSPLSVARLATGATVTLQGTVAAEPDLRDGYRLLTVDVTSASSGGYGTQPATGLVEATVYGPDDWFAPAYGDTVTLTGKLQLPGGGYVTPGVLARMTGARATVQARGGGNPLLAALYALRVQLAQAIQRSLPEPEAALLIGILLGLKTPTLRARLPLFTATGTIHLVVPAGLKVSTLAELATYAVARLGRWPRTLAALLAVGVYAALGGGGPAAIRAAIMGALLALAPALGRAYTVFTALALAVLVMTAFEPLVIYDAGFQLTTLATFGLPLLVPPIQRRLAMALYRLPGGSIAAELLAVTLAAQIATLPVLAFTFHQLSLVAPFANLLTVPLLAPLLVLGVLLAGAALAAAALGTAVVGVVGVFGALSLILAWVTWPLLWFVDAVIGLCAALPGAAFAVPSVLGVLAWAYFAALAAAIFWLAPLLVRRRQRHAERVRQPALADSSGPADPAASSGTVGAAAAHATGHVRLSRGLLAVVLAVSLPGACGAAAPALADRSAHLDFLDVGPGGEAILLRLPSGAAALIEWRPQQPQSRSGARQPASILAALARPRALDRPAPRRRPRPRRRRRALQHRPRRRCWHGPSQHRGARLAGCRAPGRCHAQHRSPGRHDRACAGYRAARSLTATAALPAQPGRYHCQR
jgi:competence protein ComEC